MKIRTLLTMAPLLLTLLYTSIEAQGLPSWGLRVNAAFVSPILSSQNQGVQYVRTGFEFGLDGSKVFRINEKLEVEIPLGIFFSQLPKSKNYQNDCLREGFQTYLSKDDSLMGRDLRFAEIRINPAIRYWLGSKVGIGTSLWASLGFYAGIEDYNKVCDRERTRSYIHLEDSPERDIQSLNLGWDAFFSFKVISNDKFRLLFEPGIGWRFSKRAEVFISDESSKLRTLSGFFRVGGYF